jgi:hypothetical protein
MDARVIPERTSATGSGDPATNGELWVVALSAVSNQIATLREKSSALFLRAFNLLSSRSKP